MSLLEVIDLHVAITRPGAAPLAPVRGVSFSVARGETLALVGESGCGKTMTCLAVAGLLPRRARIAQGEIRLNGRDLAALRPRAARALRRPAMATVFQDATNALNPVRTIGWQIAEAARLRSGATRHEAEREAIRLLGRVGLPEPERRARDYPHQFSGGMNQRAMIALAIAGGPDLLIADEATTALDVTVQAQILTLIDDLRHEFGMGVLFVTHDLGVVAQSADRVAVMYCGRLAETAPVATLFRAPLHPYAAGLLSAAPRADENNAALGEILGAVPALEALPPGCAFAPRCPRVEADCARIDPSPQVEAPRRTVSCLHPLRARNAA